MPRTVMRNEGQHLYAEQPATPEGRRLSTAILQWRQAERTQAAKSLRSSGLSVLGLTALRYLVQAARDGRDLSPKDVIVMLDTSSANVTNVIERLVERGYLTRDQHPTDRRAHFLRPTPDGVRLVDESYTPHHTAIVKVIDSLDAGDAEVATRVIQQLVAGLDALDPQSTDEPTPDRAGKDDRSNPIPISTNAPNRNRRAAGR